MIRRRSRLRQRPGVALTILERRRRLAVDEGEHVPAARPQRDDLFDGFKLFYEEDGREMTPTQVLALRPQPDFVVYE